MLNSRKPAFTILEIALTLAIIGIMISVLWPIAKLILSAQQNSVNEQKIYQIRIAMQSYLLRHGYLPKAGDKNGNETAEYRGLIPFKTLGLTKKHTVDAKGKPFLYFVHKDLTFQQGKLHLPITTPQSIFPKPDMISFHRIYKFNKTKISKVDNIDCSALVVLDHNGENVLDPNDNFYIMLPLKKCLDAALFSQWLTESITTKNPDQLCSNVIAWAITNNPENVQNDSTLQQKNGILFYQSRFDMAAQIGFPFSPAPIYVSIMEFFEELVTMKQVYTPAQQNAVIYTKDNPPPLVNNPPVFAYYDTADNAPKKSTFLQKYHKSTK